MDKKGKTLMHQAAEQVLHILCRIRSSLEIFHFQGSAKAVSLIKAVKPTSVDDQDENG